MRRLTMFAGLFLAGCGVFWIWMLYGFTMMLDQDPQHVMGEAARWRLVAGDGSFPIGVLLIIAGAWLMFRTPRGPE